MKNILKILKYDFKGLRFYIEIGVYFAIMAVVLGISTIVGVPEWAYVPLGASILGISFIGQIIKTSMQLSKEEGRFLFMASIKGGEYLSAKFIGFIIVQLILVLPLFILSMGKHSIVTVLTSIIFGTFIFYIIIVSMIVIVGSFVDNVFFCIVGTIAGIAICTNVIGLLSDLSVMFLPYVYVLINEFIKIGLIQLGIYIIFILAEVFIAGKLFNSKLDIN